MAWSETCVMDERLRFVLAALEEEEPLSWLCEEYGISRQTGYKWLERYRNEGPAGLRDRSHAALRHGRARDEDVVRTVLSLRERYPFFGPRKLRVKLGEVLPGIDLPALSTIGDWLRKEGLTRSRRRRPRCAPYTLPLAHAKAPNDVWSVDFKGWFRTGDGSRCDPLTVSDGFSRYVLRCQTVARPDHEHVRPVFEQVFRDYGLPRAIRSDNGAPFASLAAGGLSRLSIWWTKLGISCERIESGQPQQNGRHERMHRTLKAETADPPAHSLKEQQRRFDRFCHIFNEERPHEALGQKTPARFYEISPRPYPIPLREPSYPDAAERRRVRSTGQIRWNGELIFVSQALVGETVGIFETAGKDWEVRFADIQLGYIDQKRSRLCRTPSTAPAKPALPW